MDRVGFAGAGLMGAGMARRLMAAGHPLVVLAHRNRARVDALLAEGAGEAADAGALARGADVVVSCLPDAAAVEALARRMVPALRPGALWIDVTTSRPDASVALAAELRARGAAFADAPVTGGPPQAERGELASLVGCAEGELARVEAVVGTYSKLVRRFGEVGAGHAAKLLNNLVTQGTIVLLAEAFSIARERGVDWRALHDAMAAGAGRSGTLEKVVRPALEGDFDGSAFTIANAAKDLRYAVELIEAGGARRSPLARAVHDALRSRAEAGHAEAFVSRLLDPALARP